MKVRIVTHAYAGDLPQYAVFLRAQLTSILRANQRYSGIDPYKVSVCYCQQDTKVAKVISDFIPIMSSMILIPMTKVDLFRRSIGRNQATEGTAEELFWFADVDYYFTFDCLEALRHRWWTMRKPRPVMVWPGKVFIHKTHEIGDGFWEKHLDSTGQIEPDFSEFKEVTMDRAIGGIQIVDGAFARKHGYLAGTKWVEPSSEGDDKPFPNFKDDVIFRGFCESEGETKPIELPRVYRLRHSKSTIPPRRSRNP